MNGEPRLAEAGDGSSPVTVAQDADRSVAPAGRLVLLLSVAVSLLFIAACDAGNEAPMASTAGEATTTSTSGVDISSLGGPTPSEVAGVPIPQSAELLDRPPDSDNQEAIVVYKLPRTATPLVLNSWYGEHLPIGSDWEEWAWCRIDLKSEQNIILRLYRHKEIGNTLSVATATAGREGTAIITIHLDKKPIPPC